jgi:hypothetical protein
MRLDVVGRDNCFEASRELVIEHPPLRPWVRETIDDVRRQEGTS